MLGSHRLAFRIARREAWRYKGRSALSITLLGLPLLGVAIGASAFDTIQLSEEETAEQYLGSNDAYIELALPGVPIEQQNWNSRWIVYDVPVGTDGDAERPVADSEILAALPEGSTMVPYSLGTEGTALPVRTSDGLAHVQGYGYDLGAGQYEDAGLEYLEGSAPGGGEAVINEAAADLLGIGVGDELVVDDASVPDALKVTGIVEMPWNLNEPFVIADSIPSTATGWLLDTPETLTEEQARTLNELGVTVWGGSLLHLPPGPGYMETSNAVDEAQLMIYGLIVVAVVMEVVLLAGPAFAISARRRTREFALMSANGATPGQIRNTVLAGGLLFGLVAAALSLAIGIGLVAAGLPWLEQLFGHRSAGLRVMPALQASLVAAAVVTGLLAALTAAISASRVNVIAALTGRTSRNRGTKRWMVLGVAVAGAGVAAGAGGVVLWSLPLMAAAIILTQLGLVVSTPALLAGAAKLSRRLPVSPRMAMREAGRNRGSAASAIAAVIGVVAAGMAFSMIATAEEVRQAQDQERILPEGTMTLMVGKVADDEPIDWEAALAEAEGHLESRFDGVELTPVTEYSGWGGCGAVAEGPDQDVSCSWGAVRPEENRCSYWDADRSTEAADEAAIEAARDDPRCDELLAESWNYVEEISGSTDPAVVAAFTDLEGAELDRAVSVLEEGGVLVADEWAVTDAGTVRLQQQISIWNADGSGSTEPQEAYLELPAMAVERGQLGLDQMFLGPGAAEAMGMAPSPSRQHFLVSTSTEPESADLEALEAVFFQTIADGEAYASVEVADYDDPFIAYVVMAVTGLCALIAFGATAVSTGLIVAEQRRDMTVLGAVGAAPGLRKRFAMWQSVVIAVFGTALGTLAGFVGFALIRETMNRPLQTSYPFQTLYGWELPWASFAIILLAVPLVAALGALVFTKAKLPSERRVA
ncbi:FtsX-like permease family protein [Glycomyces sp. NPDC049804]|uniref:FtsX-like permease family protein n=1 Tax=Glycomyces sp. NPDC049804 TaxID=3154363 RepID=UPI0034200C6D